MYGDYGGDTEIIALCPTRDCPEGALAMNCQVCQGQIIYRPGWPEVICSTCGAVYTENAPEANGAVAENADTDVVANDQAWEAPAREETRGATVESFSQDPALPA